MNKMKFHSRIAIIALLGMAVSACSFSTVVGKIATVAGVVKGVLVILSWLPPASDLATFDATHATQYIDLQNMSLTSTTGDVTITISDETTGQMLGENTFGYSITGGHQVSFTDAPAVTNWVRSFSTYDGFVDISVETHYATTAPPPNDDGVATSTFSYSGTPYSSATATISSGSACPPPNYASPYPCSM